MFNWPGATQESLVLIFTFNQMGDGEDKVWRESKAVIKAQQERWEVELGISKDECKEPKNLDYLMIFFYSSNIGGNVDHKSIVHLWIIQLTYEQYKYL